MSNSDLTHISKSSYWWTYTARVIDGVIERDSFKPNFCTTYEKRAREHIAQIHEWYIDAWLKIEPHPDFIPDDPDSYFPTSWNWQEMVFLLYDPEGSLVLSLGAEWSSNFIEIET